MNELEVKVIKVLTKIYTRELTPEEGYNELKLLAGSNSYANHIDSFKRSVHAYNLKNKSKYSKELVAAFIAYWTRLETDGKLKFLTIDNFKVGNRLATFYKNESKFAKSKQVSYIRSMIHEVNPLR